MKKFKFALCLGVLMSVFAFNVYAGITFLPNASTSVGSSKRPSSNHLSPIQKCKNSGYYLSRCGAKQKPTDLCPYSNSYFKRCCDREYQYTIKECISAGLKPSSSNCGGLYKCQ